MLEERPAQLRAGMNRDTSVFLPPYVRSVAAVGGDKQDLKSAGYVEIHCG
jgi:hypothetical protein